MKGFISIKVADDNSIIVEIEDNILVMALSAETEPEPHLVQSTKTRTFKPAQDESFVKELQRQINKFRNRGVSLK